MSDIRRQMTEDRSQMSDIRRQMTEKPQLFAIGYSLLVFAVRRELKA